MVLVGALLSSRARPAAQRGGRRARRSLPKGRIAVGAGCCRLARTAIAAAATSGVACLACAAGPYAEKLLRKRLRSEESNRDLRDQNPKHAYALRCS
jgi:hypothetical protein